MEANDGVETDSVLTADDVDDASVTGSVLLYDVFSFVDENRSSSVRRIVSPFELRSGIVIRDCDRIRVIGVNITIGWMKSTQAVDGMEWLDSLLASLSDVCSLP